MQILTKSKDFKNIIEQHTDYLLEYPEKYFILSNLEDILNKSKMLNIFDLFVNKFGKKSVLDIYKSNYQLPIFKRGYNFYWISFLITKMETESELRRLASKFTAIGIDKSDIRDVVKYSYIDADSLSFPSLVIPTDLKILDSLRICIKNLWN
ncbi:MAG: hypothetical protein WKF59_14335 [Chitinophagaceae bacterium]